MTSSLFLVTNQTNEPNMKGVVAALFVAMVAVAADERCPSDWWQHEKLLVHEDCRKYYMCTHGEPVEMSCCCDLFFNAKTGQCDWQANVDCEDRNVPGQESSTITTAQPTTVEPTTAEPTTTEPTTAEPTTTEPTTAEPTTTEPTTAKPTTNEPTTAEPTTTEPTTAKPTTTEPTTAEPTTTEPTTSQPTTAQPTTAEPPTPAPGFLENGCPVNPYIHWLLPVEGDCNGFYYCVWGELVRRACPAVLHFNRILQVCDWPANAGCNASVPTTVRPTPTNPTTPGPTTAVTTPAGPSPPESGFLENGCPVDPHVHWLLPVKGDCNGFYYCVWGELVLRACPPTMHFNKELQVCDWPAHAGCNASEITITPQPTTATPSTMQPTTATPTTAQPTTATPPTPAPTTIEPSPPESGFLENGCPVDPHVHWLLPVEGDCNGFYYCVWGELVLRSCPPTLHFNKKLQVCDWPAHAGCNESETATIKPTPANPNTTEPTPANPNTTDPITADPNTSEPATAEPPTIVPPTPAPGFLENGCPVNPYIHWLLPVEGDCNGFYYCVWGELVQRACPPTLHFNKNLQVCDWPANAGCSASTPTTLKPTTNPATSGPTTTTTEISPPESGFLQNGCPVDPHVHWLLPVEGDCNGFYYCVWGDLVLRACPPTLHFNKEIQVCDWPTSAGCTTSVNKHNIAQYSQWF